MFSKLYDSLTDEKFITNHKLGSTAFERDRYFSFKTLITYQLQKSSRSILNELSCFFSGYLEQISPTKSAYSKARKKLNPITYDHLSHQLIATLDKNTSWKGHQVKGVDGSTVILPNSSSCRNKYGEYKLGSNTSKTTCMGRISVFYDINRRVVLGNTLDNYRCSEKEQFLKFSSLIETEDVLVMDNYFSKKVILETILNKRAHFVVPLTAKLHLVRRFLKQRKKKEQLTEITFTDSSTKESIVLKGRLMKKKVNGDYHVLFTSLKDKTKYSCESIFELYHKRWKVETCYLHLKKTLELADWTGTSTLAVAQDFKAKVFLYNLTRALLHGVMPNRKRKGKGNKQTKRKRIINFSNAINRCKIVLINILKGRKLADEVNHFLINVKATVEYSRVKQSNPRNYWEGKKYYMNQKHA